MKNTNKCLYFILLILSISISCSFLSGNNMKTTDPTEQELCFKKLETLVRTSEYGLTLQKKLKKKAYVIYIDTASKEMILIQVLTKVRKGNGVTLGWLKIDLKKDKIHDVTLDPNNVKPVKHDTTLLQSFKKDCLKHCLD